MNSKPTPTNGHGTNGHGANGHGTNGHATNGHTALPSTTARDFLAILFRQRGGLILCFSVIFLGALIYSLVLADRYQAQAVILVDNGQRANAVVTPEPTMAAPDTNNAATEEEMNSEVGLLQSQDLLEQVVIACGLDSRPSLWTKIFGDRLSKEEKIGKAVQSLANKLDIEVVKRTNLISVNYPSSDPQLAAQVVKTLTDLYLKKHAAVHRPSGSADFFEQQTEQYRKGLSQAESQLVRFTQHEGVVSAQLEKDAALQKLIEFEAMQAQTQSAIAEAQHRIRALQGQMKALPPRMTTQIRTSDSAELVQQLKATLLTLELKRTELLEKFDPSYRPVQEVEQQIAQTHDAIAAAEKSQWRDETTDRDPNFEWVREELTKADADLAGLMAREQALTQTAQSYQAKARWLQQQGVVQEDLTRNAKVAEDNYVLYLHKAEESRISDALDTRKMLNVAIAEAATVPILPVHSNLFYIVLCGFIAGLMAVGWAFVRDKLDPTLRTPWEVEATLNIPVLAALPKKANGHAGAYTSHVS